MNLRNAAKRHPVLALAFVLALGLTVVFAGRFVVHAVSWNDRIQKDQPIEAWMTPGYVAHSWHLPKEMIGQSLGLDPDGKRGRTLEDLAQERGIPVADLIAELQEAITAFRVQRK